MATYGTSGTGAGSYPNYTADPTAYDGTINGLVQSDTFDLTVTPLTLQMTQYIVGGGSVGEGGLIIEANSAAVGSSTNRVGFQIYQSSAAPSAPPTLDGFYSNGGVVSHDYNIPREAHLRLRVSGASLLWETSADGTTWTTRRTVPTASLPGLSAVKVGVYTYGSNASGLYGWTMSSPSTTPSATVPAAPSVTAVRSTADPTAISATWTQGSTGGSAILDQEVSIGGSVVATVSATTASFAFTGQPFDARTVSVRVRNAVGHSTAGSATVPLYTPPSVGLQALGQVYDDFNDASLDAQWVVTSGVQQVNGQVFFPAPSTVPAQLYRRGDARNATMHFRVTPVAGSQVTTEMFLRQTGSSSQAIRIFIRDGVIYSANEQGAADPSQGARPYSATADRYLRILNGADNRTRLYTSGDSATWTELSRSNFTSPNWLADAEVGVRVFTGSAPVTPTVLPLAPASASTSNVTTTTARLGWTPPDNAASAQILGYQVSWGGWTSGVASADTRYMDLTGFSASTSYDLEVWAVGAQGRGPSRTHNFTTPSANPSTANPSLLSLPSKVTGLYHTAWGLGIDATRPPSSYNLQYIFHAVPSGAGDGSFTYGYALPANRAAARARGTRLILTVGGARAGFQFTTRPQSQAFVDSIKAINTQFGGTQSNPAFDGVDFNNFEGEVTPNLTENRWISQQLRLFFGANFIITCPPAPWRDADKVFCSGMLSSGDMSYAAPQYYDGPGLQDPQYIINSVSDWVVNVAGGDASKIVVGFGLAGGANYSTVDQMISAWNTLEARYPTLRGMFLWEQGTDLAQNWPVATRLNPLVLS